MGWDTKFSYRYSQKLFSEGGDCNGHYLVYTVNSWVT